MKIITKNCLYILLLNLFLIITAQAQTWNGSVSTDWNNNDNWDGGAKPTATGDVIINSGGNQPVILASTVAIAKSVQISTGASLTIQATGSLSINVSTYSALTNEGTFINNGTLNIGNTGNVDYYGIYNASTGSITNGSTGIMNLDKIQYDAIYNEGLFNNNSTINVGTNTSIQMSSGVNNTGSSAIFNNNSGSNLIIKKCATGVYKDVNSTFSNTGIISVGVNSTCAYGIYGSGILNNNAGGTITIDNVSDYALYNLAGGTVTNAGTLNIKTGFYCINNSSNFTNTSTGIINVDGASNSGIYHDGGIFSNSGKITAGQTTTFPVAGIYLYNGVTFNNNAGAEINIIQASNVGLNVGNGSVFTNNALVNISAVSDYGFYNQGTVNNNSLGTISIDGFTYNGFYNVGVALNNSGKIIIGATSGTASNSGFSNQCSVVNSACAQLRVLVGMYYNVATKTTTNAGLIEIKEQLLNAGTFTNNGVLKYGTKTGTGGFSNNTNSSLIVNNNPEPIFTYGGTYDGTVNGIFTNATATTSAGTFTAPNTFTSSGLPAGSQTLYAKITPQGGACNFIVPFTYVVPPKPEIDVKGNSINITSGDITPSLADSTDFGILYAGISSNTNTFRIENTGNATLTLGTNPVTISGTNASDFTIVQPSATSIAASNYLDFKITFNATTVGVKEATISIANDDSNENPFTFKVRGTFQFIAGDFVGLVKIKDGTQASGKILTSDANGVASWKNPTSGLPNAPQAGDMVYYNGSNWVKLPAGQNGQTLYFCNGAPHWGPCPN